MASATAGVQTPQKQHAGLIELIPGDEQPEIRGLSDYICDLLAVPIPGARRKRPTAFTSQMSARAFVAVVLAWGIESAARVIRAGRGGRLQGVGSPLLMRIAPFRLLRPARPESAPAGPKAGGRQEGADQPWRRDGR